MTKRSSKIGIVSGFAVSRSGVADLLTVTVFTALFVATLAALAVVGFQAVQP